VTKKGVDEGQEGGLWEGYFYFRVLVLSTLLLWKSPYFVHGLRLYWVIPD